MKDTAQILTNGIPTALFSSLARWLITLLLPLLNRPLIPKLGYLVLRGTTRAVFILDIISWWQLNAVAAYLCHQRASLVNEPHSLQRKYDWLWRTCITLKLLGLATSFVSYFTVKWAKNIFKKIFFLSLPFPFFLLLTHYLGKKKLPFIIGS